MSDAVEYPLSANLLIRNMKKLSDINERCYQSTFRKIASRDCFLFVFKELKIKKIGIRIYSCANCSRPWEEQSTHGSYVQDNFAEAFPLLARLN